MTLAASMALRAGRSVVLAAAFVLAGAALQHRLQVAPPPHLRATDVWAMPREKLVARDTGYDVCAYLNRIVPAHGKVLGIWENRLFFLDRDFEADPLYEAPSVLARLRDLDDADAFARELGSRGFTHVVLNPGPADLYAGRGLPFDLIDPRVYPLHRFERDTALLDDFITRYLERLPYEGENQVYALRAEAAAPASR